MTLTAVEAKRLAALPQARADKTPIGDLGIGNVVLAGRTLSANVASAVTSLTLERTIDGASTVTMTLHDTRLRELTRQNILRRGTKITVNGLTFVLVRVEKTGRYAYTLTFEDEAVWALRQNTKPKKATRSASMTRFKFIAGMVEEVNTPKIGLWVPEVGVKQPIEESEGDTGPYEFTRGDTEGGEAESSWDAIRRLADEVQARAFVSNGVMYVGSDTALLDNMPRYRAEEGVDGIDLVAWTLDEGIRVDEATISAQAKRWSAPPGTVVSMVGQGPANGEWIVSSLRRDFTSVQSEISLIRPQELLPEPAGTTVSTPGGADLSMNVAGVPAAVVSCLKRAEEIHAKQQLYKWGGGHEGLGSAGPFDCSGMVSNVLGAGGLIGSVMTTLGLLNWGEAGSGQWITVWVNQTHTFMTFTVGGESMTYEASKQGDITGRRPGGRSTAGFQARHYPGT